MSEKIIYEGKYLRFMNRDGWEYVERVNCAGIVIILAVTEDRKAVFVEQFRAPVNRQSIEWPAGLVSDLDHARGETDEMAALRELEEETGYRAESLTRILSGPINTGMAANDITLFYANKLKKVSAGGGDLVENITVHEVPLQEVDEWLERKRGEGIAVDPKVYAGLYFIKKDLRS